MRAPGCSFLNLSSRGFQPKLISATCCLHRMGFTFSAGLITKFKWWSTSGSSGWNSRQVKKIGYDKGKTYSVTDDKILTFDRPSRRPWERRSWFYEFRWFSFKVGILLNTFQCNLYHSDWARRSVITDTHLPWIAPNQQIVEPNKLVSTFHNMGAPCTRHEEQIIGNSWGKCQRKTCHWGGDTWSD